MERRWPYNTKAAEACRLFRAYMKHKQPDPDDLPPRGVEQRRWPANTNAAHAIRDVKEFFRTRRK